MRFAVVVFLGLASIIPGLRAQSTAPNAKTPSACVLMAVEGTAEVLPAGATTWKAVRAGQVLNPGDHIRTGARSRATIRLSDLSVMRASELMTMEILPPSPSGGQTALSFTSGRGYFLSREKPHDFQLRTPSAVAAIRGTEFNLEVTESGTTVLTLIDGAVNLSNEQGALSLAPGQQGTVSQGQAPVKTAVVDVIGIIQWSLYYPAVLDADELDLTPAEREDLRGPLDTYRSGDLLGALEKYPAGKSPESESGKIFLAGLLFAAGQVEQGEAQLALIPGGSRLADALRQMVATVKNEKRDRISTPTGASEWLAESYYQQSRSKLVEALHAARMATERAPKWGAAWVRVAELEFGFGRNAAALEALNKGLELSPRNAEGWALKGFLLSSTDRRKEALVAMDHAIELDPALGNAWLGRGLMRIQAGHLLAGRDDLLVAAELEPQRAVLRSYLGKAFAQEGDLARAAKELQLADQLDPNDPTSRLYQALVDYQQNRINDSVRDLEKSRDLNDNRSVFRSQLLLDQDRAVRSANLAAIYRDAGISEFSQHEAANAVNDDYVNYSGHLFLSEIYDDLRDPNQINLRYETPWFNELLLANLLAPVGAGNLSQSVSQQEYSRLFESDHIGASSSAEYFSRGDFLQRGSVYGTIDSTSFAIDSDYRSTRGYRANDDDRSLTLYAKIKQQITPQDSVLIEAIESDTSSGDVAQYYDPRAASSTLRTHDLQQPLVFGGYHHEWSPGVDTLFLAGRFSDNYKVTDPASQMLVLTKDNNGQVIAIAQPSTPTSAMNYESDLVLYSAELQQIFQIQNHGVILGGRLQSARFDNTDSLGASSPFTIGNTTTTTSVAFISSPIAQQFDSDFDRADVYGYYNWRIWDPFLLTAGVSYDRIYFPQNHRSPPISNSQDTESRVSPKAGFTWTPGKDTTVRAAYTRSLGGLTFDQSIRLEPSQVDGFNQAFRSLISESLVGSTPPPTFDTYGVGLSQKFHTGTYFDFEADLLTSHVYRELGDIELTFPPASNPSLTPQTLDYQERTVTVAINQLLGDEFTVGARYRISDAELTSSLTQVPLSVTPGTYSHNDATLQQVNVSALYNHPCGFFSSVEAVWYDQNNRGYTPAEPGDSFWQVNLYAGYRFLQRRAELRVGLLNVANQDYQLNPLNLYEELPHYRTLAVRCRFNF